MKLALWKWATGDVGWESLIDRSVGMVAINAAAIARIPAEATDAFEVSEKRDELKRNLSDQERARLASEAFFDVSALPKPEDPDSQEPKSNKAKAWNLGGQLKLSHHCLREKEGVCREFKDEPDGELEAQIAALRVVHSAPPSMPRAVKQPLLAETRLALARGGIERDVLGKSGTRGEVSKQAGAWVSEPEVLGLPGRVELVREPV